MTNPTPRRVSRFRDERRRLWRPPPALEAVAADHVTRRTGDALVCLRSRRLSPDALMTLAMSEEEAHPWADTEAIEGLDARPRSTNLLFVLCEQPHEQAEDASSERAFWLATGPP